MNATAFEMVPKSGFVALKHSFVLKAKRHDPLRIRTDPVQPVPIPKIKGTKREVQFCRFFVQITKRGG